MEDPRVGAVIVGTGFGVLTHLRAMRSAGIEVLALVGRDPVKAADRAGRFGVPHATCDLADALDLPGVDAVAVATPPHSHAPIVLQAIDAGKHIVCEKPFASDASEAALMLDAAQRAGIVHMLGTEFRFGTGQAHLARTVRAGAIGIPKLGLFQLHLPTHADPGAELPEWWQLASEGGGWLGAHGTHVIDQVRSTMGEITGVSASLQQISERPAMTADDTYSALLRLDQGATVLLNSSCAARGSFVSTVKVIGSAGAAWTQGDEVWIDVGAGQLQLPTPDDLPLVLPDPPPSELVDTAYDAWHSMGVDLAPYTRLYKRFRDLVAGRASADDPVAATFVDGVASQRVLDAIRVSSDKGGELIPIDASRVAWSRSSEPVQER
jgi:predicted dehydrogenase